MDIKNTKTITDKEFKELLVDDNLYYGEVRDYAISASSIGGLLDGSFGNDSSEWKKHFEIGKLFHVQTLEPEKLGKFDIRDVSRRKKGDEFLKQSEADMCAAMKVSHDSNATARGVIYGPGVQYEVPSYTVIEGVLFIGKADIVNPQIGYLGDLKSTGNFDGFDDSVRKWYGPQLWLYYKIFGMPTAYVVTEKKSVEPRTDVITPAKHHYANGKAQVLEAIEIYKEQYTDHYANNLRLQEKLGLIELSL